MTEDELKAIKARHAKADTLPRDYWNLDGLHAHYDREQLLDEIERLTTEAAALREMLSRIEVKQPDDAGCVWLLLSSGTYHAALEVGKHNRIAAKAAIAFETARRAALEGGR